MENSKIEWTDHTFNPWIGCTKVSAGCQFCYAEQLMDKRYGRVEWGPSGTRIRTSEANWRKPLQWNRQKWAECRKCKLRVNYAKTGWNRDGVTCPGCGELHPQPIRPRVFCASLADIFEDRPELVEWRADLFRLIQDTPHLDWLLLTKRPENVNRMIEEATGFSESDIWIGTSIENQEQADKRIPELLHIPARVRFLSMEPLLGQVEFPTTSSFCFPDGFWRFDRFAKHPFANLSTNRSVSLSSRPRNTHRQRATDCSTSSLNEIDWVIVGGESGPNARPMHPDWARSIRDQCQAFDVPFLFKQWGEWMPDAKGIYRNVQSLFYGEEVMHRVGKKTAGRLLDGVEWSQYPPPNP